MINKRITCLVAILLFGSAVILEAKRAPAKVAEPVVIGSVCYSASSDPRLMGFIIATDNSSGRELWRKRIYRVRMNPLLEQDIQWVFITSLVRRDQALLITNEKQEQFTLDLATGKVTRRAPPAGLH